MKSIQLEIEKTSLDGVLLIGPPTVFEDFRGAYVEIYNEKLYEEAGIGAEFVQDDISVSAQHVLRGIHGDRETSKLVTCLYGKFYLVVVNNDPVSPQCGQWVGLTLSDRNRHQVLIPPGFGIGHLVLSEQAIFHYKQSTYYNRASQFTVVWNDPRFDVWWPIKNPILSQRDEGR